MIFNQRVIPTIFPLIILLVGCAFSQQKDKSAYGILIDNTGSLRRELGIIQLTGKGIIKKVNNFGAASVFTFETDTSVLNASAIVTKGSGWSHDIDAVNTTIDSVSSVGGQTALFDAISFVGKSIDAKAAEDNLTDKIIFLITDGEDRVSKIKEKQLIKELKEKKVKVYAIGFIQELDNTEGFLRPSMQIEAKNFLDKITKETGGNAVFSKSNKDIKIEELLTKLFAEKSN